MIGEPLIPQFVTLSAGLALIISTLMNISGLYLVNYVFTNLDAHVAGNLLLLDGVFAVVIGLVLYKEIPTSMEMIGALLIITCAFVLNYFDQSNKSAEVIAHKDAEIV